ncbi:MAG: C-terminal binding protein [Anaerolineales bacterium]|nr:C-terminal binding protein [Anaerolineales bacterium]
MSEAFQYKTVLVDYDEDLFSPRGWEGEMLARAGIEWVVGQHRTPETALEAARDADVVIVQSVRRLLTRPVIEGLAKCRCAIRLGIGYDAVDVAAATERGILVCNVPDYCVDDVADHALALLMGSVRHVARQDRWIRAGRWDRTGARPARRMKGCTMGFVAFGRIARALAERVSGFGMTLLAYDPYLDAETMALYGVEKVELDELLQRSDFISVHTPLTDQTHHLLSTREFGLMKEGMFLVNTSRGAVIDESALVEALRSGKVWGVGLDVMEQEPLPSDSPLREFENVIFTPHVGANSEESVDDLYRTGCRIAIDVINGIWPDEVVNPAVEGRTRYPYQHS